MSFICQECGEVQDTGSKPKRVITQRREKIYPERKEGKIVIDNGGRGWEIVAEKVVCDVCQKSLNLTF